MGIIQDNDPHFDSEYMQESTSSAWLIHNEYVGRHVASQIILKALDVNDPPIGEELDAYLIGSIPTGEWEDLPGRIAFWQGGWKFIIVKHGMRVMVNSGLPGQHGYWMDFWVSGWSAHGGSQLLVAADAGGGNFEAPWDLKHGSVGRIVLSNPTTTMVRPTGVRYGRTHTLIVQQDGTGGRLLALKTGEWMLPGGVPLQQPTPAAGAVTVYTFINPGENFNGPMLTNVALDIQNA